MDENQGENREAGKDAHEIIQVLRHLQQPQTGAGAARRQAYQDAVRHQIPT